jgi:glycosyltransferase involved in cell wall biosynthesis
MALSKASPRSICAGKARARTGLSSPLFRREGGGDSADARPYNSGVPRARAIAINSAIVGDRPTGLGLYALRVIEALDALGERLIVFTSRPDLVEAPRATVHRAPAAVRPEHGARGHLMRLLWVQSGLRVGVRRTRPDLLLNLMPEGLLYASVPQVTTVHDLLPLLYPAEYPRQQYYFRYYVPAVLRHSRAVIADSESTRRDLIRVYRLPERKVRVVLCGYDARTFSPDGGAVSSLEPYALYVGNVLPHKNLLRLVDAFAGAVERVPGRLVIRGWGRPAHVALLRERIAERRMESRVDWQAYAPADELPSLYRGARMLVLPSLYEGFGLTALEAMGSGTPVVTSNVSSIPEVVGDAALLVDPLDTAALGDAIARLFSDDRLAKDLRERGIERARLFSWERTARGVQAVVRETLDEAA